MATVPQPSPGQPPTPPASGGQFPTPQGPWAANPGHSGDGSLDSGATPSQAVFDAIKRAAEENGVPLALALAIAQHESGFDAGNRTGDNGHSWGLYQLYDKGEGAGMGNARLDPYTNASTALKVVGDVYRRHQNDMTWGQIAAAAQRPADKNAYASAIDDVMKRARNTGNGGADYFSDALKNAHVDPSAPGTATAGGTPTGTVGNNGVAGGPVIPSAIGGTTGNSQPGGQGMSTQFAPNATLAIQNYGYIAALADKEPELQKLMAKYANQDLSVSAVALKLEGEIRNTNWYKRTNDQQRAAEILQAQNPAEYHRQYANTLLDVTNLANQLGVQLPGTGLADFATTAYTNGWTPAEQKHYLLAQASYAPGPNGAAPTGDIGQTMTNLHDLARQYLVPLSQDTQQQWASKIMNGQVQQNDYLTYLKTQAKSLFPGMSAAIDSGITPQTYTDPYKQIASQTLEVPPDSVNFNDPKWSKALFQVDAKTGMRTTMSLADWGKELRSDPTYGYSKTPGAQKQAADFAENILQTFGAVGNYGGNG